MVAVSFNSARYLVMDPTPSLEDFHYALIAKKYHKVANLRKFWSKVYVFILDQFN